MGLSSTILHFMFSSLALSSQDTSRTELHHATRHSSTMANPLNDWHTFCNWLSHRHRGHLCVIESADYIAAKWLRNDLGPLAPDYTSVLLSKRSWETEIQVLRHQVKALRRLADDRINKLDCRSLLWLGGPEWLLCPPSPSDMPWPTCLAGERMRWPMKRPTRKLPK